MHFSLKKFNDLWEDGKSSKVVCTVLCWHKKIALGFVAASAGTTNKFRLKFSFIIKAYLIIILKIQ